MHAGRFAAVTGAGSGNGKAIAETLLNEGASVAVLDIAPESLTDLTARFPRAFAVQVDVADSDSVRDAMRDVEQEFGRLDLLVNNAGIFGPTGPPDEIDLADWRAVVEVNLTGAFLCAQHAMRMMKTQDPRGGRIINNGSISAHTPRPGSICYTATKHAMTGLTKSLSLDGRPYGIACGQIDIGNAATDMTRPMGRGVPQADGSTAVEPTFDPQHAADAVLYMASLPLDANVQFLTITATTMPYIGRG
jgi:NAD(P)-dependent dehydrogenase (short-subunit alcohol dehydrogenase family)